MSDTFEIEQEIQVIHIQIGPRLLASQFEGNVLFESSRNCT